MFPRHSFPAILLGNLLLLVLKLGIQDYQPVPDPREVNKRIDTIQPPGFPTPTSSLSLLLAEKQVHTVLDLNYTFSCLLLTFSSQPTLPLNEWTLRKNWWPADSDEVFHKCYKTLPHTFMRPQELIFWFSSKGTPRASCYSIRMSSQLQKQKRRVKGHSGLLEAL